MDETDFPSPSSDHRANLDVNFFQFWIFHLEITRKLLYDELAVHPELDFIRAKFDRPADSEERSGVFSDIVRSDTEVLVTLFERFPFRIGNIDANPCRTRISTSSTVGINEKFHL